MDYWAKDICNWGIFSSDVNSRSSVAANVSDVVNFLSTQWSADGSTSSEPMGLCITSIVKTLTDNHTLGDLNHQGHHTTLLLSETLLSTAQVSRCIDEVRSLESTGSPCGEFCLQISTCILAGYRLNKKLTLDDMRKQVIMCQWFCGKIDAVLKFLDNIWFSDKAHFLLSGHMNSKKNIFWGSTSLEHCLQRPLHPVKCTAWVTISKHGIIGPFWFEDVNEGSVTINIEQYVQVLSKFWTALGWQRGVVKVLQWLQQDGATPTPQTNHWHGYSNVSLTDWSATGVTRSGRCIHRTWNPQIFICEDTLTHWEPAYVIFVLGFRPKKQQFLVALPTP